MTGWGAASIFGIAFLYMATVLTMLAFAPFLHNFCWQHMPFVDDKRHHVERRIAVTPMPQSFGERRLADRRQTTVRDISFIEWATYFSIFRKRLAASPVPLKTPPGVQ